MKRVTSYILSAAGILAGFAAIHLAGCAKQTSPNSPAEETIADNSVSSENAVPSTPTDNSEPDPQNLTPELREIQDGVIQNNSNVEEPAPCIYGPPEMLNPPQTDEDDPKAKDEVEPYKEIRWEDPGMVRALYGVVTPNVTKK